MVILGLLLGAQAKAAHLEFVAPILPNAVTVEAMMTLPPAGPRERAEFAVLTRALLEDTDNFNHRQLLRLTSPTGDPIHAELLPDGIRIRYSVESADAGQAMAILAEVFRKSALKESDLAAAKVALQYHPRNYWASALDPEVLPMDRVLAEDVRNIYRWIGQPSHLWVTVAADERLEQRLSDKWDAELGTVAPEDVRLFPADKTSPKPAIKRRGKLTTIVLRGQPIDPAVSGVNADFVALFGLGGGKGSAVFQALREGLGWSYRQEALLRNSVKGLEPVVQVVTAESDADLDRANAVLPTLEKAVDGWTEADLKHALAAADALWDRGIGLDPLYFKSTMPVGDDALFLKNYWRMKTGFDWDAHQTLELMSHVDLASMKRAAHAMLDTASVEIIRGSD